MKTVGLCTHFTETDEWAFEYALNLARARRLQLNICHWLRSPYKIRRDIVYDDLFTHQRTVSITPELLNQFELRLREYYEPKLGDFSDVAFKLCEGLEEGVDAFVADLQAAPRPRGKHPGSLPIAPLRLSDNVARSWGERVPPERESSLAFPRQRGSFPAQSVPIPEGRPAYAFPASAA